MNFKITDKSWQFLKYCISGGFGIIIDIFVFFVLVTFFNIEYLISNLISFSLGTIVCFYMQKNWTFQYTSNKMFQFYSKYLLSIGVIFLLNNALLITGVKIIHLEEIQAKFFQIFLSAIMGYLISKNFVFAKKRVIESWVYILILWIQKKKNTCIFLHFYPKTVTMGSYLKKIDVVWIIIY